MANNILRAILNIASYKNNDLKSYASTYLIRINAVGEQLEFYIKDAIASSFNLAQNKKEEEYSRVFSYSGNQNNPPDMIIRKGDAFEIKKIKTPSASLALNSSPPKDALYSSDPRIIRKCKECEGVPPWNKKDLFYVIGNVKDKVLNYLFFIDGRCYAAEPEIYYKIYNPIKKNVDTILDELGLEKGKTKELGKVKRVDPLGITELRVRGMWSIKNPLKVFTDFKIEKDNSFYLFALMRKEKFLSYPKDDIKDIESNKYVSIKDVKIKDPNNPTNLMEAKLITFVIK